MAETRNYGATANDKADKLIQKLLFATASVVALVFIALGRREAAIVGSAVILTLTVTLFASWAWGFTLNRVSLFALIFSIGILVDDAIVVVENIHRHQQLHPGKPLAQIIPGAVDEVGGPTILATLTVIAALLPMAFVSGLMGPYMSPIPINASMGMLLSLAIAFVVTPWLARLWMKACRRAPRPPTRSRMACRRGLAPLFERIFRPLLDERRGARNRWLLGLGVAALIAVSLALPALGLVLLKMLPFDNKSEFQVVVDMPAGTPVEQTAAVLHELGAHLAHAARGDRLPGLCRHRRADQLQRPGAPVLPAQRRRGRRPAGQPGRQARTAASRATPSRRACARRCRRSASASAPTSRWSRCRPARRCCRPWWPRSTAPRPQAGAQVAKAVRACSPRPPGVVDVDDSSIADAPHKLLLVDRRKAAMLGVSQQEIVTTLRAGLAGEATAYLHDESKYPAAATLQLPAERHGDLDALLQLSVRNAEGKLVPIRELVTVSDTLREQPIYHKDLLPVNYVVADMAGTRRQPAVRHVRDARRGARRCPRRAADCWPSTSSASRRTRTAATPSSGTASGRSPTRPSATWAPPTPSG